MDKALGYRNCQQMMKVNVLHNTHVKFKYNKIHNLILINKFINIVITWTVITVTIWSVNIYIYTFVNLIKCKICSYHNN